MNTMKAATRYRINQEIKFLYTKKCKLNEQLYTKHLECAALWPTCWTTIQEAIDNNLQLDVEAHYNNLNKKLDSLQEDGNKHSKHPNNKPLTHNQQHRFYPRTVNLTNIIFTKEEQELLDLGLQYNIQQHLKSCWTNLIMETEQVIRLLDTKLQDAFRLMAAKNLKQI